MLVSLVFEWREPADQRRTSPELRSMFRCWCREITSDGTRFLKGYRDRSTGMGLTRGTVRYMLRPGVLYEAKGIMDGKVRRFRCAVINGEVVEQ